MKYIKQKEEEPVKKKGNQKQEIFNHFLNLYKPNLYIINQHEVSHEIHHIYQLVSQNPKYRSQLALKKLKLELNQLKCFKVPPYHKTNPQFLQIFKRDNCDIINWIVPFIDMTTYTKGSIVQVTAAKRETIKILIMGQVCAFQPVNKKSYKNCQQKIKNGQINLSTMSGISSIIQQTSSLIKLKNPQESYDDNIIITKNQNDQPHLNLYSVQQEEIIDINKVLTINQCQIILSKQNIMSPMTPHNFSRQIVRGDFLFDKNQTMFIDQKPQYYSTFICCSNCIFLQIRFQIAKQIIFLINNDRERPFIHSLLFKFPMLKYFQAKQYVTQEFIVINQIQDDQRQEEGIKATKMSPVPIIKQLKVILSSNFQLGYTGELFLIISGSVTMIINQIFQRKPSNVQYAISQKRRFNKQILHLYQNDIFGFEQIGENKFVNLRYLVSLGAKILRINNLIFRNHLQAIPQLKKELQKIKQVRNKSIKNILQNMQHNLENQEIQRHKSITYSQQANSLAQLKISKSIQLRPNINPIMQLNYYGHENYESVSQRINKHFSPQANGIQRQFLSPQIVKNSGLGLQFSKNLPKHPKQAIQIKHGWIQIRNKKGTLLRKKKVKQSQQACLISGKGDSLLRRLGVLNSEQIAKHNLDMVLKRPSKYQFQDLKKQAKQFKKIKQQLKSLPKLTKLYAKKQDRLFAILYKKTHL